MARISVSRSMVTTTHEWIALCQGVERAGLAAAWSADLPGRDSFVDAALALQATSRITIGTALTIPVRSPLQTATAAAELATFAGSRFVLGLGISTDTILDTWHGVPYNPPIGRMREFAIAVTGILRTPKDQLLDWAGVHYRVHAPGFDMPVEQLPVLIGAHGEQMTRLAARLADGILFHFLTPRQALAPRLGLVRELRERGDQPDDLHWFPGFGLDSFITVAPIRTAVHPDEGLALHRARTEILSWLTDPRFAARLPQFMAGDQAEKLAAHIAAGKYTEAARELPEDVIRSLTIITTPDRFVDDVGAISEVEQVMTLPMMRLAPEVGAALGVTPRDIEQNRLSLLEAVLRC